MTFRKLFALTGGGKAETKRMREFCRELEADTLARTIYGEARGEGEAGMRAVAAVVMNRVREAERHGGYWWGDNIIQVCQKPYQFSCWNRADPNFKKLLAADEKDLCFAEALRLAKRAASGRLEDPTNGATHYHADTVKPYWSRGEKPLCTIGRHVFYRLMEK